MFGLSKKEIIKHEQVMNPDDDDISLGEQELID